MAQRRMYLCKNVGTQFQIDWFVCTKNITVLHGSESKFLTDFLDSFEFNITRFYKNPEISRKNISLACNAVIFLYFYKHFDQLPSHVI